VSFTANALAPFEAFAKIPRLHGDTHITEKIDGTNACVEYAQTETGYLMGACSRNRRLVTVEVSEHFHGQPRVDWHGSDNAGFGQWVLANHDRLVRLGYGRHFGEWYGQGIQRGYGLDHKRFALFREPKGGLPEGLPENVSVVPTLAIVGRMSTTLIEAEYALLKAMGSRAVPGFMNPEGVVVFHARAGQLFKLTDAAGPKGQKDDS
jgi:hypothetical protein